MFVNNLKEVLRKCIDLYILRLFLPKRLLLKLFGYVAIGETKRLFRYPLWVTVDLVGYPDFKIKVDGNFNLPFLDNSLKALYSSHNIEHISLEGVHSFFREASRVLKSGGEFLIDIPCSKKAYSMLKIASENKSNISLKNYLEGLEITDYAFEKSTKILSSNSNYASDVIRHPYNMIINGIIASYMSPSYNSCLLPVIHDPLVIDEVLNKFSMDEFFNYIYDSIPFGYRYSGGHCEAWYDDKLAMLLFEYGFEVNIRQHKESKLLPKFLVPDRDYIRRDKWSVKISAIKK